MAEQKTDLKVSVKKLKEEGCALSYEVQLPRERFDAAVQDAFVRIQARARIPGFRAGKAPMDVVRRQFSAQAKADAADGLIQLAVPEALRSCGAQPLVPPSIGHVHAEEGKPFVFTLELEVAPKFEAKGYKGLALTRKKYAVTDEEVGKRLLQLQEGNARLEVSPAAELGKNHYAVVDYEMLRAGKALPGAKGKQELVDMSAEQSVEGLVEGLLGAKRGESREFPVKIAKQEAVCRVSVSEIKEKKLPALDDDFAKDMGFDALDALKAKLRELAGAENEERTERELVQQIDQALLEANKFPVPPTLAEHQLEQTMHRVLRRLGMRGLPEAETAKLREKLRSQSEDEVRLSFVLEAVARQEKISVGDEDFQKELDKNLAQAENEDQKKDVREFFSQRKDGILSSLKDRKVLEFVRKSAKITEAAG